MKKIKSLFEVMAKHHKTCLLPKPVKILVRITYILIFFYLLLLIFAARLEGYATFPGVFLNTLEYTKTQQYISNLPVQDIFVQSGKNTIYAWYIDNKAPKTVYYFHGNGGELRYFQEEVEFISSLGYNVLALEYPGYGKSTGFPFYADIKNATEDIYAYAQKTYGLSEKNTIVWGYSIGTGVATEFAMGKDIDSLVLLASYTSRYDLARFRFGFPLQKLFFLPNSFVTLQNIQYVSAPKYIMHGTADAIVPYFMGREVFESARGKKYFFEIPNGDHFRFFDLPEAPKQIQNFLQYHTLNEQEIQKMKQTHFLESLDMEADTSFQKYIDPERSFSQKWYVPEDMRSLSGTYIIDVKGDLQLRNEAARQFEKLAAAFHQDMGEKVVVVSSYRSYSYQVGIKAGGCPDALCAKAGHSEHQSGLALDVWSASSDAYWKSSAKLMRYYDWFSQNAHLYGFHNSYQNGRSIDGYEIEPWHWRYLGVELASYLKNHDMTFAQYFARTKKEP